MEENIHKVWGVRKRILLTKQVEMDHLTGLIPNSFCSTHTHKNKINKFICLQGSITIRTEFGETVLGPGDTHSVFPPLKHRFEINEPSEMIEIAFVNEGVIDPGDIDRETQGGRIVNGKEMTLNEMRDEGLLEFGKNFKGLKSPTVELDVDNDWCNGSDGGKIDDI